MKYQDVLQRIRAPHLRQIAEDRLENASSLQEAEQMVSDLLGMHLVESLREPGVELTGFPLPEAHEIDAGEPATSFPNDTYPNLFETILRAYTEPGDAVLHVFTRSSAPHHVGRLLGRQVVMVDEYVSGVENLLTPNLLAPSKVDFHQIANQLDLEQLDDVCDVFELIHFHLPCPGVVNRLQLIGDGGHSVYGRSWEKMSERVFWQAIKAAVQAWTTILQPLHLTIQCGFAKRDNQYGETFPQALQIAHQTGWSLDGHWRLQLNPLDGPTNTEALQQGWLLAFENRTGGHR